MNRDNPNHEARMREIDALNTQAASMPDGAFMAFMENRGVEIEELEAYSVWCKSNTPGCRKPKPSSPPGAGEGRGS